MDLLVKNVPENLNLSGEVKFGYFIKILSNNYFDIDFKQIEEKDITKSMINNISEMKKEITKNWLKNFTSISS